VVYSVGKPFQYVWLFGLDNYGADTPPLRFGHPCYRSAEVVRFVSSYVGTGDLTLLHTHCDFVTRAAHVHQAHGNRLSGNNPNRNSDVHLVKPRRSWGFTEKQNLGALAADDYSRRDHTPVRQAGQVDFQEFSSTGRIARRNNLMRSRM